MRKGTVGALVIAAVSTLGDFVWANWIPGHRPVFGLTHGTLLFLCMGLYLGSLERQRFKGAIGGALIGFLAAGSFYVLAPLAGYSVMFLVWALLWLALAVLEGRILREADRHSWREALTRGLVAAITSGIAFYMISGIWRPFSPRGWDYAVHFVSWTVAYLPGFLALLTKQGLR